MGLKDVFSGLFITAAVATTGGGDSPITRTSWEHSQTFVSQTTQQIDFTDCSINIAPGFNLRDGNYIEQEIQIQNQNTVVKVLLNADSDEYFQDQNIQGIEKLLNDLFIWEVEGIKIVDLFPEINQILREVPLVVKEGGLFNEDSFTTYCIDSGGMIQRIIAINSMNLGSVDIIGLSSLLEEILHVGQRNRSEEIYREVQSSLAEARGVRYDQVAIPGRSFVNEAFHHARMAVISSFNNKINGESFDGEINEASVLNRYIIETLTSFGQQMFYTDKDGKMVANWINSSYPANPYSLGFSLGFLLKQKYYDANLSDLLEMLNEMEQQMHLTVAANPEMQNQDLQSILYSSLQVEFQMNEELMKAYARGIALRYGNQDVGGPGDDYWPMPLKIGFQKDTQAPTAFNVSKGIEYVSSRGGWVAYNVKGEDQPYVFRIEGGIPFVINDYDRFAIFFPDIEEHDGEIIEIDIVPVDNYFIENKTLESIGLNAEIFNNILREGLGTEFANIVQLIYSGGGVIVRKDDLDNISQLPVYPQIKSNSYTFSNNGEEFVAIVASKALTSVLLGEVEIKAFSETHGIDNIVDVESSAIPNTMRAPLSPYYPTGIDFDLIHWAYRQIPPIDRIENPLDLEILIETNLSYIIENEIGVSIINFGTIGGQNSAAVQVFPDRSIRLVITENGIQQNYEDATQDLIYNSLKHLDELGILSISFMNFGENGWINAGSIIINYNSNLYGWEFNGFAENPSIYPSPKPAPQPIRTIPLDKSEIVLTNTVRGFAEKGDKVKIIETSGNMVLVKNSSGTERWVPLVNLTKTQKVLTMANVPETLRGGYYSEQ